MIVNRCDVTGNNIIKLKVKLWKQKHVRILGVARSFILTRRDKSIVQWNVLNLSTISKNVKR